MKMVTEDYVSFETAKLLKEKGFEGQCHFTRRETETKYGEPWNATYEKDIPIPTLQMAMKWLREEKDILISVNPTLDKDGFACVMYYIWDIDDIETRAITSGLYSLEGYNECIEAAIKYCLENLI